MKKETKIKLIDKILYLLSIIVPIIVILWIGGMVFQWIDGIKSRDLSFFLTYGQITLTLFGFTMISAIFEKNKGKAKELKDLFHLSLIFLVSSISFFFLYFSSFVILEVTFDKIWLEWTYVGLIIITLVIGFLGFVYGIFILLQILLKYAKGI